MKAHDIEAPVGEKNETPCQRGLTGQSAKSSAEPRLTIDFAIFALRPAVASEAIIKALEMTRYNRAAAAKLPGVSFRAPGALGIE